MAEDKKYIYQEAINVFPSARRGLTKPQSRAMTEAAFVRIINKLIDSNGFVITDNFNAYSEFEFNIYGYYFQITSGLYLTDLFSNPSDGDVIYGKIVLKILSDDVVELAGQDENNQYQGVEFILRSSSETPPTSYTSDTEIVQYLPLLEYSSTSSAWDVSQSGKYKFDRTSMRVNHVDGGVIL